MTAKQFSPRRHRSRKDLAAAALHDPAAFAELFEQFWDSLLAESRRRAPSVIDPSVGDSDLVQDAFMAAYQHSDEFRGHTKAEVAAFLRKILHRQALNQGRPAYRAAARVELPSDLPDSDQMPPDEALATKERAATVREAVAGLPADHRAALELRFDDRRSFDEIGRRLGRSADAARMVLARAVRAVRRRLRGRDASDR